MTGKRKMRSILRDDITQNRQARSLDALAEFESFEKIILPKLKKMVLENWSPEKIRKHFAPMVQAKMIEKAFKGDFKAIKDTLDRHEGMAVQRVEQTTVYQKMSKAEQAALILQKLKDAKIIAPSGEILLEEPDDYEDN